MTLKETIDILQNIVDKTEDPDEFIAIRSGIDALLQVKAFEDAKIKRCEHCKHFESKCCKGEKYEQPTV